MDRKILATNTILHEPEKAPHRHEGY